MTVREVYAAAGGNYDETVGRLGSEELVNRFTTRFSADDSFPTLEKAFGAGDVEAAFRAAHTLKGVAKNLGFADLGDSASELTEILRNRTFDGAQVVFERVKADYLRLIRAINAYNENFLSETR